MSGSKGIEPGVKSMVKTKLFGASIKFSISAGRGAGFWRDIHDPERMFRLRSLSLDALDIERTRPAKS